MFRSVVDSTNASTRRITLARARNSGQDAKAGQYDDSDADPAWRHVQHVGSDRKTGDNQGVAT
jgi:hypothetical protein